jgi:hypothetical protein
LSNSIATKPIAVRPEGYDLVAAMRTRVEPGDDGIEQLI